MAPKSAYLAVRVSDLFLRKVKVQSMNVYLVVNRADTKEEGGRVY